MVCGKFYVACFDCSLAREGGTERDLEREEDGGGGRQQGGEAKARALDYKKVMAPVYV